MLPIENGCERRPSSRVDGAVVLAAVIVEPIHRSIPPDPDFLAGLRELCTANDIVLIFDEIVTGFRVAWGGAQEHYGVVPDLATYGKTMTGGTPIGAVAGRADLLALADPAVPIEDGGVLVGSTNNGNAICAAAANVTLDLLEEQGTYEHLYEFATEFRQFICDLLEPHGFPVCPLGEGPIIDYAISDTAIAQWEDLERSDTAFKRTLERAVLDEGVLLFCGSKKYISLAHDEEALETTKAAYRAALDRIT